MPRLAIRRRYSATCVKAGNWYPSPSGANVPYVTPLTRKRPSPRRRNFPSVLIRVVAASGGAGRTSGVAWTAVLTIGEVPPWGNFPL